MIRDSHGSSESTAHHNRISDMIEQMQRKVGKHFLVGFYRMFFTESAIVYTEELCRRREKRQAVSQQH